MFVGQVRGVQLQQETGMLIDHEPLVLPRLVEVHPELATDPYCGTGVSIGGFVHAQSVPGGWRHNASWGRGQRVGSRSESLDTVTVKVPFDRRWVG